MNKRYCRACGCKTDHTKIRIGATGTSESLGSRIFFGIFSLGASEVLSESKLEEAGKVIAPFAQDAHNTTGMNPQNTIVHITKLRVRHLRAAQAWEANDAGK